MTNDALIDSVLSQQAGDEADQANETPVEETQEAVEEIEAEADENAEEQVTEEKPKNDPEKLANALNKAKGKIQKKDFLLNEERRLNQDLMQRLERLEKAGTSPETQDEDSVEKYVDTRAEQKARAIFQEELSRQEQASQAKAVAAEFRQRVEKFKDKMPDIMEVLESHRETELPDHLIDAIKTIPEGPAIAAYAFKEDLMDDIAELPPALAMLEFAKIKDTINSIGTAKPVTKTPAPMVANKGTSGGSRSVDTSSTNDVWKWYKS